VVEHRGGAYSGHYVCYRRRSKANGADWLFVSDQDVRSVSWDEVRGCQAYMLFYEAME
jgi:ubiquitin carboxyl-terminal hydrolase 30